MCSPQCLCVLIPPRLTPATPELRASCAAHQFSSSAVVTIAKGSSSGTQSTTQRREGQRSSSAAGSRQQSMAVPAAAAAVAAAAKAVAGAGVRSLFKKPAAIVTGSCDSIVTVTCTMNNIHICASNIDGMVVAKMSGGNVGFKHRSRASPEAAIAIGKEVASKAFEKGYRVCHLRFRGPSRGRSGALRGIQAGNLAIADIKDITRLPTNGCRPKKARRL